MKYFGDHIRELREKQNLPLRKVAAYLDIDPSILSKIERGERAANKNTVIKIAEFFSLNQKELLNNFFGERIAKLVYKESNCADILKVAEGMIEYLKTAKQEQIKMDFNE